MADDSLQALVAKWRAKGEAELSDAADAGKDIPMLVAAMRLHCADELDAALRSLPVETDKKKDDQSHALEQWRSWAQFVFLDGGPVSGTDKDLQRSVCERYDRDVAAARQEVAEARRSMS